MDLSPGTRLGPYQVVGPLGEGGIGEVAERSGSWALGLYGSALMALVAAVMAIRLRAAAAALKAADLRAVVAAR